MKVKSVQQVLPVADIKGRGMRVGVSQRAQDQQEKITEEEERDQEATSWWRRRNSGKKFRGSKGEKEGSVRRLLENQARTFIISTILLMLVCYDRLCEFWS